MVDEIATSLREKAWAAAAAVVDPEIPVLTIADLGVLREVRVEGEIVTVSITPTYSGCPAMSAIARDVETALRRAGIDKLRVDTVLSPAWTTDWLSEEGRRKLAAYGIAPPVKEAGNGVSCPRCGSPETECISAFGSTACKALYRCRHCAEPFDYFKCL